MSDRDNADTHKAHPDVEILERLTVFKGYFRVDRYRLRHRLHDGGWSEVMTREIFERGHAVAVLPYDPVRDEVALIEQFRPGAYAAGRPPWLVEIVAGIIGEGESEEQVAIRETSEETGLAVTDLVKIIDYLVSPGGASETCKVYCGRVDTAKAGGIHGLKHEHEDIRTFVVPAEEAIERLNRGEIVNAMSVIALQWFEKNRPELRRRWKA